METGPPESLEKPPDLNPSACKILFFVFFFCVCFFSSSFLCACMCACSLYPLEPHLYIAKLGYAGVYQFFLFLL